MALAPNKNSTYFLVKEILKSKDFFTKIIPQGFYFFRSFDRSPRSEFRWDCMSDETMKTTMLEF